MPSAIDLVGHRFGKLTVDHLVETGRRRKWFCKCDCGGDTIAATDNLRSNNTRSCGSCYRGRNSNSLRHGGRPQGRKSSTYNSWQSMKRRCLDASRENAKHYALAGISYDPNWERFENFLADMGERPAGLTLDRKDNTKGYSKENCRWATPTQQTRNRRISRVFEFEGRTLPIAVWARELGITYGAAIARIKRYNSVRLPNGDSEFC